jgi:hypothetical protein
MNAQPTHHDIAQATVCLAGILDYGETFVIARDRIAALLANERISAVDELRTAADRLDGEAGRLPVLGQFATKFRSRASQLEAER